MVSRKPILVFFFAVYVTFPFIFVVFMFHRADERHYPHRSLDVRYIIMGFVLGSVLSGIPCLGLCFLIWLAIEWIRGPYRRSQSSTVIFMPQLIKRADHLAFLQVEDVLSSLEVIGSGGCGMVFKAQLPVEREGEEPKFIAIKKIQTPGEQNENPSRLESHRRLKKLRQIQAEICTVGHIRHCNLVPLAAHVVRPDCHYLVYEYMENGSLHNALKKQVAVVGAEEDRGNNNSSRNGNRVLLSWPQRLRVAVGIASGLEYLHEEQKPKIIHRDLKPTNILLDGEMKARIADFGLAREIPEAQTHVSTSDMAGTYGYYAPEYLRRQEFTTKCDVYSFGVILAVLVTGKEPSDQCFHTSVNPDSMVKWLHQLESSDRPEAIDPAIAGAGHDEQILLVLHISLLCTDPNPNGRPRAKDVRCMLTEVTNGVGVESRDPGPSRILI